MTRLDSRAPELAEALRNASLRLKRKAALVGCEVAVAHAGLDGELAQAALDALRGDGDIDQALRQRLEDLAARLDDEYLVVDQKGGAPRADVLALFLEARAASALAFAVAADAEQLHEALYEASAAVQDPSELIRRATEALRP